MTAPPPRWVLVPQSFVDAAKAWGAVVDRLAMLRTDPFHVLKTYYQDAVDAAIREAKRSKSLAAGALHAAVKTISSAPEAPSEAMVLSPAVLRAAVDAYDAARCRFHNADPSYAGMSEVNKQSITPMIDAAFRAALAALLAGPR